MIKFKCEFCQQRLGVPDGLIGKKVRCNKCRSVHIVTTPEEYAAKEARRAALVLPSVMKVALPFEPKEHNAAKVSRTSSLLDLSSSSGSFVTNDIDGLFASPGTDSASRFAESKILQTKRNLPAFVPASPPSDDPGDGSDTNVTGLFDMSRAPSLHQPVQAGPAASQSLIPDGPARDDSPESAFQEDDLFKLSLLDDGKDGTGSSVNLDGFVF